MNRQTTALFFVLALLAVFEMATAATPATPTEVAKAAKAAKAVLKNVLKSFGNVTEKAPTEEVKAESTTASGVATYSALGAIVTAVLANFF